MATNDFKADFPPNRVMALNVRTMTAAVSGGPNFKANSAMIGAKKVSKITPIIAPTPCDRKDKTRAFPALPLLAIGYPSKVTATAQGSPGMLKRMEQIPPP